MAKMADPMIALRSLQQAVFLGDLSVTPQNIGGGYFLLFDEPNGGKRFSYPKIINKEVQAISIFGLVEPIKGIPCFSVGYAVNEKHRGKNLAFEAVNRGIHELKTGFSRTQKGSFYVEAVIDKTNTYSIKVAEKLFSKPGVPMTDHYSGTPSLHFLKLVPLS